MARHTAACASHENSVHGKGWRRHAATAPPQPGGGSQYHVVFDFLEHVIVGHDEFLGCVAVGDVGQDAQRLTGKESVTSAPLSGHFVIQKQPDDRFSPKRRHSTRRARTGVVNYSVGKPFVSNGGTAHLLFDLYTVLRFQDEGHGLHDLLPMRTHDLVYVLRVKQKQNKTQISTQARVYANSKYGALPVSHYVL